METFYRVTEYHFSLTIMPEQPGLATFTLLNNFQSVHGDALLSSKTLEWNYLGVVLKDIHIVTSTPNTAVIRATASKPCNLYALPLSTEILETPTLEHITSKGAKATPLSTIDSYDANTGKAIEGETVYEMSVANLMSLESYIIYVNGHEPFGPHVATPINKAYVLLKRGGGGTGDGDDGGSIDDDEEDVSHKHDGTDCPYGWNLVNGVTEMQMCSGHGFCRKEQCM